MSIPDAWNTNDTVLWRGANPYTVVTPMPDVNYSSISFNFNSSSGTYDEICVNGTCMMDLVRLSGVPTNLTNVYCNAYGMCYMIHGRNTTWDVILHEMLCYKG